MASLALALVVLFTAWLIHRDVKERASVSGATWIVVGWAIILGSRPVSSWYTGDVSVQDAAVRDAGNPQEAVFYIALELAGLLVLMRRGVRVPLVIKDNKWLFGFYLFWCLSTIWSNDPVITLKRLIKDLGSVIVILIILTERNPGQALRAAFVRCAYLGIPLSVVLIKYYGHLGRMYGGYNDSDLMYVGVTLHKNTLGALAMVSALFLLWDVLESHRMARTFVERMALAARAVTLTMCWYLLWIADSATSLVCAVLASSLLVAFRFTPLRRFTPRLGLYGPVVGVLVVLVDSVLGLQERLVLGLGRDMTFTTRTDIWPILLRHADSPLLGSGFNTFWAGPRLAQLQQHDAIGGIVQAHSGYLETYLNGGWVGVILLALLLLATYVRVVRELPLDAPEPLIRFIALLVALSHNFAEASFNKVSLIWLITLFAILRYRHRAAPVAKPLPVGHATPQYSRVRPSPIAARRH